MGNAFRNRWTWIVASCAAVLTSGACTVHDQAAPALSGPSEAAMSVSITATPDSILQDGASQSSIVVFVRDASARAISGQAVRLDMAVNGAVQDFGTLAARTIVTGTDGRATTVYTAPALSPTSGGTGSRVQIMATPTGTNYQTASVQIVEIRLVPPGVILPPAGTPVADFTVSPTPVNAGVAAIFDASASCPSALQNGACPTGGSIASYSWNFGDGTTGTGRTVTHTFNAQQTYSVILTVTNDRGVSASATHAVPVGSIGQPSAAFVFSPIAPQIGQSVVFNGDTSKAAPGHTLTAFNWNFGDGGTATGFTVSHTFTSAGVYNVVLSVLDDVGQKATATSAVTVTSGGSSNLTPAFTMSPTNPVSGTPVSFNANTSTPLNSITLFDWDFGDGTILNGQTSPAITHTFFTSLDATFTIRLTVHNATGQSATATQTLQVASGVGPTALFSISPSPATVGAVVTFDGAASIAGGGVQRYEWDFGDGTPVQSTTLAQITHSYSATGTYTIRLTVFDTAGRSAATTHTLLVQ